MNIPILIKVENLSFIYESELKNAKIDPSIFENRKKNLNQIILEEQKSILDKLKVLKNINLQIYGRKFIAILGSTGSGKSTLVRTFNGLIPHFYNGIFYGIVNVHEKDTIEESVSELSLNVGLVFQNPENQLVMMNVEREIAFGLENRGTDREIIKQKVKDILNLLNIEHLKNKHPYELSGGEQQKVAIASILIIEPKVIILDEPTAGLDQKSALKIIEFLKKLNKELGITVIIIEHRLGMLLPYCDELILMKDGEILDYDSVEKILNKNLIYSLPIELPYYIQFLKYLKDIGIYKGEITSNFEIFKRIVYEIIPTIKIGENKIKLKRNNFIEDKLKFEGIELKNVSFCYPNGVMAIKNISLKISKGECIGIIGKNGAGKSTLLKLLNGLLYPTEGTVLIDGIPTNKYKSSELTQKVGLIFQNPERQLFCNSVEEEIEFSLKNLRLSPQDFNKWKYEIIEQLNLKNLLKKSPFSLSGGEKKKVSLATILCRKPDYILLDEPTVGQDKIEKEILQNIIKEEKERGKTIIIVSHDTDFIYSNTEKVIILEDGEILAQGSTESVLKDFILLDKTSILPPQMVQLIEIMKESLKGKSNDILDQLSFIRDFNSLKNILIQ